MARRTHQRSAERCPCGLPKSYQDCCAIFHGEQPAPTGELLMRSRFTAFALADDAYLLRTWHPRTRPPEVRFDPAQVWFGLQILDKTGGGLLDSVGTVHFQAEYRTSGYRTSGKRRALQENSRFVRHGGLWVYVGPALASPLESYPGSSSPPSLSSAISLSTPSRRSSP